MSTQINETDNFTNLVELQKIDNSLTNEQKKVIENSNKIAKKLKLKKSKTKQNLDLDSKNFNLLAKKLEVENKGLDKSKYEKNSKNSREKIYTYNDVTDKKNLSNYEFMKSYRSKKRNEFVNFTNKIIYLNLTKNLNELKSTVKLFLTDYKKYYCAF